MAGRTAVVTGGGSGMGEAVSRRLARDGMAVGVIDINGASASAVAESIVKANGKAFAVEADISDLQQVKAAVSRVRQKFEPITVFVNAAGIESHANFWELNASDWDRVIAVNLTGAYNVTQAILPDMKAQKFGRIVYISSSSGQTGNPQMAGYASSKGGVIALTKSLAMEFGPLGITVNSVSPGLIETPMCKRALQDHYKISADEIAKTFPIQRLGQPDEIAAACAYLVSDEAGYTSGQILGINGGIC